MTATKAIPVKRLLSAQAYQLIDREIAKYPADQKQSAHHRPGRSGLGVARRH